MIDRQRKALASLLLFVLSLTLIPAIACEVVIDTDEPTEEATATLEPAARITPVQKHIMVVEEQSPLRSGPGTEYELIGEVAKDEILEVTGQTDDPVWFRVVPPGSLKDTYNQAWISAVFIVFLTPTPPQMPPPGFPLGTPSPGP